MHSRWGATLFTVLMLAFLWHGQSLGADRNAETRRVSKSEFERLGLNSLNAEPSELLKAVKILLRIPDYESWRISIAEAKRMDLNGDGIADIVATVNKETSGDPVGVFLLVSSGDQYVLQEFDTERASLDETVRDLRGEGKYEILVTQEISSTAPHAQAFYWYDVYAWDGSEYVPNNASFIDTFYIERYIPLIAQRIMSVENRVKSSDEREREVGVGMLDACRKALERVRDLVKRRDQ